MTWIEAHQSRRLQNREVWFGVSFRTPFTEADFEGEPHAGNDSHAYPISHSLVDACELPWLGAPGMTRLLTASLQAVAHYGSLQTSSARICEKSNSAARRAKRASGSGTSIRGNITSIK